MSVDPDLGGTVPPPMSPPPPPPPLTVTSSKPTKTLLEVATEKFKNDDRLLAILREYQNRSRWRDAINEKHKDVTDYIDRIRDEQLKRYAARSLENREDQEKVGGPEGRIERLKAELRPLAQMTDPVASPDLVFRADGRSPWTIWRSGGFEYRAGGSVELARSGLRSIALQRDNVSDWLQVYRMNKVSEGMPTVSTGRQPNDLSGASNARWQYAIEFNLQEYALDATTFGVPYTAPKDSTVTDRLWLNAGTLEAATEIALSGGKIDEVTFLTPVPRSRITGYVLLTDGPDYLQKVWRPFNKPDLDAYRAVLLKYGDFNFSE